MSLPCDTMPHVRAVVIAAVACTLGSIAAYLLWRHDPSVVDENRLLEWTQASLLMLAAIVHGW